MTSWRISCGCSFYFGAIWENKVMRSKSSSNTKPRNKKGHILDSLLEPRNSPFHKRRPKRRKGGLNEKVSSAVFRARTDKQKKFYVCAKCNLTLQTSSIHWNILPPRLFREESTQNLDPATLKQPQKTYTARWFVLWFTPHPPRPKPILSVRVKLWTAANIVKHQ